MTWFAARHRSAGAVAVAAALALAVPAQAGDGLLPPGTILGDKELVRPREVFISEMAGGQRPAQSVLGDLAFGSPLLLGPVAQRAGVSCGTCHIQGAGNPRLFVPQSSGAPGTFDTSGPHFNPAADDHVANAVTVPSLRGARFLAPYTRDGRLPTLREFTRNAIVNEFAGAEPAPKVLDALVAYMQDIDFLPNGKVTGDGRLTPAADEAAHRGEAIFRRPFPGDPAMSCAACHVPSAHFVDHRTHDIGTGGQIKTPTLRNARFNAPYFHDARFRSFDEVVGYFDGWFGLKLSDAEKSDLVAYLHVVGDGDEPHEQASMTLAHDEVSVFAESLDLALPADAEPDWKLAAFVVDSLVHEVRELQEMIPDRKDTTVQGGEAQRAAARNALSDCVFALRRAGRAVERMDVGAARDLAGKARQGIAALQPLLIAAEPWSLYNPTLARRRQEELERLRVAGNVPN